MKRAFLLLTWALLAASGCLGDPATDPSPVLIQANEIGVLTDLQTGELLDPLLPGLHLIEPGFYDVTIYTLGEMVFLLAGSPEADQRGAVDALTLDGAAVRLEVSLLFRVDPTRINQLHARYGKDYFSAFVDPAIRDLTVEAAARFSADALRGDQRAVLETELKNAAGAALAEEGLILSDLLVSAVDFPE